jgi:hypothetical protein
MSAKKPTKGTDPTVTVTPATTPTSTTKPQTDPQSGTDSHVAGHGEDD